MDRVPLPYVDFKSMVKIAKPPRITGPTLKVIGQLMTAPEMGIAGSDISKETGISSGTLYPILSRLEQTKWITSEWEKIDPSEAGRPRKRLYTLTPLGHRESKSVFDSLMPSNGRIAWQP
jgi:PadR family transcriptional regulator